MNRYSTELGNRLRDCLFTRNTVAYMACEGPVTYDLKPGNEALATMLWAIHGVCLSCNRWSITRGRCAECARGFSGREG